MQNAKWWFMGWDGQYWLWGYNNIWFVEKGKIIYEYDYGDCWEHEITLEKILPSDNKTYYPICLTGKKNCPPEDCGGSWGYNAIMNGDVECLDDDWDAEVFDPKSVRFSWSESAPGFSRAGLVFHSERVVDLPGLVPTVLIGAFQAFLFTDGLVTGRFDELGYSIGFSISRSI